MAPDADAVLLLSSTTRIIAVLVFSIGKCQGLQWMRTTTTKRHCDDRKRRKTSNGGIIVALCPTHPLEHVRVLAQLHRVGMTTYAGPVTFG